MFICVHELDLCLFLGCDKGIARGCGWQKLGAFVNLGSYYLVGVPFAVVLAFVLHMKGEVRFNQFDIEKQLSHTIFFILVSTSVNNVQIRG